MQLLSVTDPRDNLEKANRDELAKYARENGVAEVKEEMPAILMRKILRGRGLVNIRIPNRPLGFFEGGKSFGGEAITDTQINSLDADAILAKEWEEQTAAPPIPTTITELRSECKRRGIKMARTDTIKDLKAKLNG